MALRLSDQALSAVMIALQKSIMEESDIVPVLKGFEITEEDGELYVTNPPKLIKPVGFVTE